MPNKRVDILKNKVFAIGGHRVSRHTNTWQVPASRERLDVGCFEDDGKRSRKGIFTHSLTLEGYGTEAEADLIGKFIEEDRSYPFTVLRESNLKNTPIAAQGSAALLMDAALFEIPWEGASHGTVKKFKAGFEPAGTSELFFGKLLYTNVGAAALEDGTITTPGLNVGSLVAGFKLACSVHVVDFPGLLGTDPEVTVELVSDAAADLLTPSVRHTFDVFTEPDGFIVVLDGDVVPVPSEPFWGLRVSIASTGPDAEATIISAINLVAKT